MLAKLASVEIQASKALNTRADRIDWLDSLRAFAVFLVIVGHKTDSTYLEQVIYSFHIPLFFWISGFLFDQSRYSAYSADFGTRFRSMSTSHSDLCRHPNPKEVGTGFRFMSAWQNDGCRHPCSERSDAGSHLLFGMIEAIRSYP